MRNGTGYAYHQESAQRTALCEGCGRRFPEARLTLFYPQPSLNLAYLRVSEAITTLEKRGIARRSELLVCSLACGAKALVRLYGQAQTMLAHPERYGKGFAMEGVRG